MMIFSKDLLLWLFLLKISSKRMFPIRKKKKVLTEITIIDKNKIYEYLKSLWRGGVFVVLVYWYERLPRNKKQLAFDRV